jgi:hypothetical protein
VRELLFVNCAAILDSADISLSLMLLPRLLFAVDWEAIDDDL